MTTTPAAALREALAALTVSALSVPALVVPTVSSCDELLEAVTLLGDVQLVLDAGTEVFRHLAGCAAAQSGKGAAGKPPVTVIVRIPLAALQTGLGVGEIDGVPTPVSAGTVRRMAADGRLIPAVLGAGSEVLDGGRGRRLFTIAQKLALAERDGGCAWAGCPHPPAYTEAHHIRWWSARGGGTDLGNGILLCSAHHHRIHDGGWQIVVRSGVPSFIPPDTVDPYRRPRRGGRLHLEEAACPAAPRGVGDAGDAGDDGRFDIVNISKGRGQYCYALLLRTLARSEVPPFVIKQGSVVLAEAALLDLHDDDRVVVNRDALDDASDHPARHILDHRKAMRTRIPMVADEPERVVAGELLGHRAVAHAEHVDDDTIRLRDRRPAGSRPGDVERSQRRNGRQRGEGGCREPHRNSVGRQRCDDGHSGGVTTEGVTERGQVGGDILFDEVGRPSDEVGRPIASWILGQR